MALQDPRRQRRVIVFTITQKEAESLAAELHCPFYHANSDDKPELLQRWISQELSTIVATGAFGTGVNSLGVTDVVHMGKPWGIVEFGQESGRVGEGRGDL